MIRSTALMVALFLTGCAARMPESFVRSAPGWKTIELSDAVSSDYDVAWQKTVDTVARTWDIELLDKSSGYIRTTWLYGISGAKPQFYRGRLTVKFPETKHPGKLEVRTNAQWLQNRKISLWVDGFDTNFERDVYSELSGRLGRTVSPE